VRSVRCATSTNESQKPLISKMCLYASGTVAQWRSGAKKAHKGQSAKRTQKNKGVFLPA
jgi:hypothetical protein